MTVRPDLSVVMVNEGLNRSRRRARVRKCEKALIFQHKWNPARLPGFACKTNSDQDVADLANSEPRRFNRFASPQLFIMGPDPNS